jgi:hypothetical protein
MTLGTPQAGATDEKTRRREPAGFDCSDNQSAVWMIYAKGGLSCQEIFRQESMPIARSLAIVRLKPPRPSAPVRIVGYSVVEQREETSPRCWLNANDIYRRIIFRLPSPHHGTLAFNPARVISFYDFLFPDIDVRAAPFSGRFLFEDCVCVQNRRHGGPCRLVGFDSFEDWVRQAHGCGCGRRGRNCRQRQDGATERPCRRHLKGSCGATWRPQGCFEISACLWVACYARF